MGGIAKSPYLEEFSNRVLLSREQYDDQFWLQRSGFPESVHTKIHPTDYDHYKAIAPGVVLVKAPGHTPGSQMIYVQLANGAQYLLVGDVAWLMAQIEIPQTRPRITSRFLHEDAAQVWAKSVHCIGSQMIDRFTWWFRTMPSNSTATKARV